MTAATLLQVQFRLTNMACKSFFNGSARKVQCNDDDAWLGVIPFQFIGLPDPALF